jgi:hypothetical protein
MSEEFEKFESELEREYARLGDLLNADAPKPELVARIQRAVAGEASRQKWRRKRLFALRTAVSTAAALLLLLFVALPRHPAAVAPPAASDASFAEWVAALDETDASFATLLDTDWLTATPSRDGDSGSMEGVIESLDESLQSFESIIGT